MPAAENILTPFRRAGARSRLWRLGLAALLLCPHGIPARLNPAQDAFATVFFFSPETNVNNFSTLKGEFDSFFAEKGKHKFQPFADRAAFEAAFKAKRMGLYLMSSWHYSQFAEKDGFDPALIGVLKGKSTQKHVLCAKNTVANAAALRGLTIASPGTREFTQSLLKEILHKDDHALIPTFKILTVPKDMDALINVNLGVAQAAVTTEAGLEKLAKINLKQHGQLKELATGPEKLLPIVVAPAMRDSSCESLLKVLAAMAADPDSKHPLPLLGLEGLKPVEEAERKILQQ